MSDSSVPPFSCPQCGAALPAGATEGLCQHCLMAQPMPSSPPGEAATADFEAATVVSSRPRPTLSGSNQADLPLPEELTEMLPHGNYHVDGFLGAGGMGAVYKGLQVRLKRPVAIKIMRRSLSLGKDSDFEQRFEREAQAMAKLNHPNIVNVIDYGEAGPDYLYIVMELIDGADLMDVIRGGQMTQEMALSLLPQICDALQFAHDHGIVHRDIKPSNIMLTRDGRIKMADFGLAKHFDTENSFRTQTGTGMGTPDYAAPEQFDPTTAIDHRADIYALGVMIYQMITGQLPRGVWKPPSQRAEVSPQWDGIVSRAMQSDPSDRYQQASEVKTDVSSIPLAAASPPQPAPTEEAGAKGSSAKAAPSASKQSSGGGGRDAAPGPKSRAPLLFGVIAGVVVLAVGVFLALKSPDVEERAAPHDGSVTPYVNQVDARTLKDLPVGEWIPLKFIPEKDSPQWFTTLPGGNLRLVSANYLTALAPMDVAIRMKVKKTDPKQETIIQLRQQQHGARELWFARGSAAVRSNVDDRFTPAKAATVPDRAGVDAPATLEFATLGDSLYGTVDGTPLEPLHVKDGPKLTGRMRIASPGTDVTELEFMILDGASADKYPAFVKTALGKAETSASGAAPALSATLKNAGWVPVRLTQKDLGNSGATLTADGKLKLTGVPVVLPGINATDVAIRARLIRPKDAPGSYLIARRKGKATRTMQFWTDSTGIQSATDDGHRGGINAIPHDPQVGVASPVLLEMAVIGENTFAAVDGSTVGPHRQALPAEGGGVALGGQGSEFSEIEVMILDGAGQDQYPAFVKAALGKTRTGPVAASPATAPKDSSSPASPDPVQTFAGHRYQFVPAGRGSFMSWTKARAEAEGLGGHLATITSKEEDAFVRATYGDRIPKQEAGFWLGAHEEKPGAGWRWITGEPFTFTAWGGGFPSTRSDMDKTAPTALFFQRHEHSPQGAWTNYEYSSPKHAFITGYLVEWDDAGGAPAANTAGSPTPAAVSTSPAAATKAAPFVNTLGMQFVPVPITGGPTDKQRVLFSIWETRVQDYEVFAKERQIRWGKPEFEQGPTHPALQMNWERAKEFCAWLTERERKAGALAAGDEYRLPTDHEWSCAVGIGDREDPTARPREKMGKLRDVYPWGTAWPPPEDAGNYRGEENPADTQSGRENVITGWRDAFPHSAPVGSFAANPLGLFDLGGNASEWCTDPTAPGGGEGLGRSASFDTGGQRSILSSSRNPSNENFAYAHYGFRVVLAPVTSASSVSVSPSPNTPFINTLGMQFVPVPIIGGPTDQQRVLFSVWETRVRDYEVFAQETAREWEPADYDQTPAHPAVRVTWDDAQAFCAWLTAREHKAGKLAPNERYRLPTDHEWSCAAGIGQQEDAVQLPATKDQKLASVYPWGTTWPPPPNAGNYWSEELRPLLAAGKFSYIMGEHPGYRDGHAAAAPVGSFAASPPGLYDLGGNVAEWCEDWFDAARQTHVLRGASWVTYTKDIMLSSTRLHYPLSFRHGGYGFRCVIAPVTHASAASDK